MYYEHDRKMDERCKATVEYKPDDDHLVPCGKVHFSKVHLGFDANIWITIIDDYAKENLPFYRYEKVPEGAPDDDQDVKMINYVALEQALFPYAKKIYIRRPQNCS